MMIVAACLFGTILGEVQALFTSVYKKNQDIEDQLEAITNFLTVNKCAPAVLAWSGAKLPADWRGTGCRFCFNGG